MNTFFDKIPFTAFSAILIGSTVGFGGAVLIQNEINKHTDRTCEGTIITIRTMPVIKHCLPLKHPRHFVTAGRISTL
jgi:hypothetical protein